MRAIHLGTSGYVYKHWKGLFYPTGLPASRWLPYFARWREQTPAGFNFACKGSRYLTHMKRLTDVGEGLERYFSVILRLGAKLGPVLWQLPPHMKKPDPERLDRFLAALPRGLQYVVEFRDAAWYHDEVLEVLDRRGVAGASVRCTHRQTCEGRPRQKSPERPERDPKSPCLRCGSDDPGWPRRPP